MDASKTETTTNEPVKASLALITARTLRDLMASRGKHVAELDEAIKAEEAEAEETDED